MLVTSPTASGLDNTSITPVESPGIIQVINPGAAVQRGAGSAQGTVSSHWLLSFTED